jgi:hypothetical protein
MDVVYAVTTAVVPLEGGGQMLVREGSHWPADDPIVRQRPTLFTDDPRTGLSYTATPVETATAVPGEVRRVRRG